jgi:hypothetical protein
MNRALFATALVFASLAFAEPRYFELLDRAIARIDAAAVKLTDAPDRHEYPGALLVAAVLYARNHPQNPRAGDTRMLSLALKLGDVLAEESARGVYTRRGDHHRDTYMWLEAFRVLETRLGDARRARWRNQLMKLVEGLAKESAERADRPAYTSPFGVSVNHTALFSATVYLAGKMFGNHDWQDLGARIMHRYAAEEQAPDGYWGEHSRNGPTTGYNYLTVTGVALYWEHSQDPAALAALRRATDFHKYFTYPGGFPVMITDDRRRHSYISPWGHFGFSHFPDGRRYAELLTAAFDPATISFEHAGRLAQDALYYHGGSLAPIPQDSDTYAHRMSVPAGIRKNGPWVTTLSGIVATQNAASRFYLDRQCSLEIYHRDLGVIVSGANSKRQPELATFREQVRGRTYHMPLDSRLRMDDARDRLSLAYNTFIADVEVDPPSGSALPFRFVARRKGAMDAALTLQLVFRPGEEVELGTRKRFVPGEERISEDAGSSIRNRGWRLSWNGAARLHWPVYPYNPYADAPETSIEHAVGALEFALSDSARIEFRLEAGGR